MQEDVYLSDKAGRRQYCLILINVDLAYTHLTTVKTLKAFTALYLIYLEEFLSVVHSL